MLSADVRHALTALLPLSLAIAGCDAGTGTSPGDDAAVAAADANDVDAWDEFQTPETCTSGAMWTHGDIGSSFMHPGRACIDCHATDRRAPTFSFAGTIYPSGHEPDDCNGVNGFDQDVHVVVTDATGAVQDVQINDVGNFYGLDAVTLPITAELRYQGRVRAMTTPAASGDCNSCHTDAGTNAAPGRLLVP